ncbi:hypothetical protein C2845_PM11G01700 [Panicum miliaceum]|uniref:Glyceraldehyde 3-phosphate dehydrogenase catalytic domain-containing protein n=1 Tax=Panicum miliaceum TaxID=4540 RepID=A0A3L6RQA2_PANMI|nr:hypothetical protein C2845_PM11G01700 [Panicum miliaceum]
MAQTDWFFTRRTAQQAYIHEQGGSAAHPATVISFLMAAINGSCGSHFLPAPQGHSFVVVVHGVQVGHEEFGIVEGLMETVHATTGRQNTVDGPWMKDWRKGRGAGQNVVPSPTDASTMLKVPIPNVCVVDWTCRIERSASYNDVKAAIRAASEGALKGILGYTDEDVVSSDFVGYARGRGRESVTPKAGARPSSSCFMKLVSWYDNEWAYSDPPGIQNRSGQQTLRNHGVSNMATQAITGRLANTGWRKRLARLPAPATIPSKGLSFAERGLEPM